MARCSWRAAAPTRSACTLVGVVLGQTLLALQSVRVSHEREGFDVKATGAGPAPTALVPPLAASAAASSAMHARPPDTMMAPLPLDMQDGLLKHVALQELFGQELFGKDWQYSVGELRPLDPAGAESVVWRGTLTREVERRSAGTPVVVKLLVSRFDAGKEDTSRRATERAIAISRLFSGGDFCSCITATRGAPMGGPPVLIMEAADGNLQDMVVGTEGRGRPAVSLATKVHLFRGLLRGLATMAEHNFVHRDIKPENLLVDGDCSTDAGCSLRIADFEVAAGLPGTGSPYELTAEERFLVAGTPIYAPPEVFFGAPPDPKGDVWAAGIVLYELLFGTRPRVFSDVHNFAGTAMRSFVVDDDPEVKKVLEQGASHDPRYPLLIDLLRRMVHPVSFMRIDAAEALTVMQAVIELVPSEAAAAA